MQIECEIDFDELPLSVSKFELVDPQRWNAVDPNAWLEDKIIILILVGAASLQVYLSVVFISSNDNETLCA